MNPEEAILYRRSVFPEQFEEGSIPKEKIERLLALANCAPTHKKTEPWRFKVALGEKKEELAEELAILYKKSVPEHKYSTFKERKVKEKIQKSGAVLLVCMQRDPKERIPEWEEVAAVAMAVQNVWISLETEGLGGYWSSPGYIDQMGSFLNLAEGEKCLGIFYLGNYSGGHVEGSQGDYREKVTWL